GDLKKTMMVGDSEVDEMAASNAKVPFVLVEDGYTEKTIQQIRHDALIKNFIGFEKIVSKYL
ncbi:MAG: HAD hydrolase-like protein, partial [Pelagibacteraceae bacterium]